MGFEIGVDIALLAGNYHRAYRGIRRIRASIFNTSFITAFLTVGLEIAGRARSELEPL
jgi:hypothetical protein